MPSSDFIAYVGNADIHDGIILSVNRNGSRLTVRVRGASGREFAIEFTNVLSVECNRPEGMMLFALVERKTDLPARRFDFANADDDSFYGGADRRLVVYSTGFEMKYGG